MLRLRAVPPVLVMPFLLLSAQTALAAEVSLDRSCYSPREPITETGTGFTPGGEVVESLSLVDPASGKVLWNGFAPPVPVGAQGEFSTRIGAPELARRGDRRELAFSSFTDQSDPENKVAFVQWTLSDWDLRIKAWERGRARARGTMVIDTYGWTSAGSALYAHYYRGRTLVKTAKVGALRPPCGDLRRRVRQFPFRRVQPGRWAVNFSTTRRLDQRNDPFFRYRVRVPR